MHVDPAKARRSARRVEVEKGRGHNSLRVIFPNHPLAVRDALASTLEGLRNLHLSPDEASTVELVLAEVMNNIVEHAFPKGTHGMIELHVEHGPDGLRCAAIDNGLAMPHGNPPMGNSPDPDLMAEGGFGWFLIRELASEVAYERVADRNRLSFRLDVARNVRAS